MAANTTQAVHLRRFADLEALSRGAADLLAGIAQRAVAERGQFTIALSGGSTPRHLFEQLVRTPDSVPWPKTQLWWGDDRTVPPDHADSNYRMAREALIDPLGVPADQVHRMPGERADLEAAALDYERALVAALGAPPVFDLMLLGMGPDGHTASLFPGSPAVEHAVNPRPGPARWVVANPVSSPLAGGTTTRLTLTAPAINAARVIWFVVAGADKAAALAHVLEGPRDPARYPAQLVAPTSGELTWLVDAAAAAALASSRGGS